MSQRIYDLIDQGEHLQQDFKFEIADAKKIARTFSAFANTQGGRLLIGVKDNGTISGIQSDEEAYMAESAAHLYCTPPVEFEMYHHKIEGKTILEITVPESSNKPHLAPWKDGPWKAFVRVDDENFLATPVNLQIWKNDRSEKGIRVKYQAEEECLFKLLESKGKLTLQEYKKRCGISYHTAKKILANLVSIGVLSMQITDNNCYFHSAD